MYIKTIDNCGMAGVMGTDRSNNRKDDLPFKDFALPSKIPEYPFYDLTILRTFLGAASQKRTHMAAKRGAAASMARV